MPQKEENTNNKRYVESSTRLVEHNPVNVGRRVVFFVLQKDAHLRKNKWSRVVVVVVVVVVIKLDM